MTKHLNHAPRTYEISVDSYAPVIYVARTPAKARWMAYQDFGIVSTCRFGEFLAMSTIRRIANRPPTGDRFLAAGAPATRVEMPGRHGIFYMRDGEDCIMQCHESEVSEIPQVAGA